MRFIGLIIFLFLSATSCFAQSSAGPDFVLTIDGTEHLLTLDQPKSVTLKTGVEVPVILSKREFGRFTIGNLSFEYPGKYSVATSPIDDTTSQHIVVTTFGTIMLVQSYQDELPSGLLDIMFDRMVEDEKAAGIPIERSDLTRKIANGKVLNGVRAHFKGGDDDVTIDITLTPSGKGGYLILTLHDDYTTPEEKPMIERFWETLTLKDD